MENKQIVSKDSEMSVYSANLAAIKDVLDSSGAGIDYSLLQTKDDCLCLLFDTNGQWELFSYERGAKINRHVFDDINKACHYMIRFAACSLEEEQRMVTMYNDLCVQDANTSFSCTN